MAAAAGAPLLDVHADCWHNRSVFTLGGEDEEVAEAARRLALRAVDLLDLTRHSGAHPRFGVVDVVPFVALEGWPLRDPQEPVAARSARDAFGQWAATQLGVPVFLYGPERTLPDVRRHAWHGLNPDEGPPKPHPTAGSVAVGCRPLMVAYNLWLASADLGLARRIAKSVRSSAVRALAFALGGQVQVSFNLVRPLEIGPGQVMDLVSREAPVERAELVGLVPQSVLDQVPRARWPSLGLSDRCTIEDRLHGAR